MRETQNGCFLFFMQRTLAPSASIEAKKQKKVLRVTCIGSNGMIESLDYSSLVEEQGIAYLNTDVGVSGVEWGIQSNPLLQDLLKDVMTKIDYPLDGYDTICTFFVFSLSLAFSLPPPLTPRDEKVSIVLCTFFCNRTFAKSKIETNDG